MRIRNHSIDELKRLRAEREGKGLHVGEINCELSRKNRELNRRKSIPIILKEIKAREAHGRPTDQLRKELESRRNR